MNGIVGDADIIGEFEILVGLLDSPPRQMIWRSLKLAAHPFSALGLPTAAKDRLVWQRCREYGLALVTGNRNQDDADSLAKVIQENCDFTALPVFTIGNRDRFADDVTYRQCVAIDLLDYLEHIDDIRGTGRLYLPKKAYRL